VGQTILSAGLGRVAKSRRIQRGRKSGRRHDCLRHGSFALQPAKRRKAMET
jgi:hypothetical protein